MEKVSVKKCRACLKNSDKTYPLNKLVIGAKNKLTYGQLLQECVRLEFSADYEHLMPQGLCNMCSQELNNAYKFIQQAQYCNNKLIHLLSKQLEKVAVKKENDIVFGEYFVHPYKKCDNNLENATGNQFRIVNTSVLLKAVELETPTETYDEPIQLDAKEETNIFKSSSSCQANTTSAIKSTTCPICKRTINEYKSLITHIRIQHDIEAPLKYLKKPEPMTVKKSLEDAIKLKPKERVFKCSSCSYVARTYGAISLHNRSKHGIGGEKFKCSYCPFTAWQKYKLFMHVKKSHKETLRALKNYAAENNADISEMHPEFKKSDENNKLVSESGKSTNINKTSIQQKTATVPTENNSDTAMDDEKEDTDDESFIRGILNVQKKQFQHISSRFLPRRCDECGNIYNNLRALKTHKKNVHISEEQYCICQHCGKKFKRKTNMRIHIETIHNPNVIKVRKKRTKQTKEKRFMCSQCSYACYSQSLLTVHENRHHTGEKPFKCDLCNAAFVVSYDLKIHRYKHTGEKPYKCLVCSKRFRVSVDLVKHTRIHTKERPYKCKECEKTFTQSYNLTLHKRTHLKQKNIKCSVCDQYFEDQTLLILHRTKENHYDEVE